MNFGGTVRFNKCGIALVVFIIFLLFLYTYKGRDEESGVPIDLKINKESSKSINLDSGNLNSEFVSMRELLSACVEVAQTGGLEVVKVREEGGGALGEKIKGKTKEGAEDKVTQGDYRSHRLMYYGLRKAFPKLKVISEEHESGPIDWSSIPVPSLKNSDAQLPTDENIKAEDVVIWIDPLDATKEYTEGLTEYVTTMSCVAVKGVPIIGVIHRPFAKETYWGVVGHSNSDSLNKLVKERTKNKDGIKVVVSISHAGKAESFLKSIYGDESKAEVISAAGAGYKVLEVVKGNADAYLHVTAIKKWDLCAGNAILKSLGGSLASLNGSNLDYSAHSDPVTKNGILAYFKITPLIKKLYSIKLPD